VWREHRLLLDQVGVYEEESDPTFREDLFDALAGERSLSRPRSVQVDRVVPLAGGAVGALRGPNAPRFAAEEALVRFLCHPHLRAYGVIGAEKGEVSVGGAASDDLNRADVVEMAEDMHQIAAECVEIVLTSPIELLPETRY